jgi:hypothetical protein
MDRQKLLVAGLLCCCLSACNTTKMSNTARTGTEQLLVSSSIDRALDKVDFSNFRGQHVFIEDKQLDAVDKGYLLGSVRHRVLNADATLVDAKDKADVVLEVRSGGVGTDSSDMFLGMPGLSVPLLPISLPEIRLVSRSTQTGIAKIGLAAYEAKSGRPLGVGGVAEAQSNDRNWYVFGVGPWESGTLKEEVKAANQSPGDFTTVPTTAVAFAEPSAPGRLSGLVQPASQESDAANKPPAQAE